MRELTDEVLMKNYAGGDMAAFECLYQRHRGPLYRYILRQVGDPATANDLFQGAWEKIIKGRTGYAASAPFKVWMYRIAHNHLIDHFRRLRPTTDLPAALESGNPGPEETLIEHQRVAGLAAAVNNLPAEQREALVLKLEAGLDVRTIATITGVNPETAKSRLRYAVTKVRHTLAATTDGPHS